MEAYVYRAALLCKDCGDKLKRELAAQGKAPRDPADEYSYDSDDFPKGPYANGGGEADTPQHCDLCYLFLENPLTSDGYNYVREAIATVVSRRGENQAVREWKNYYGYYP